MPEIVFTPGGTPIEAVRAVPDAPYTTAGNPVRAIRVLAAPAVPEPSLTPGGYPFRPVRLVDAAGLPTASIAAITTQPEVMFTPDGFPIQPVRIVSAGEVSLTTQGFPIEAVWLVDATGGAAAADVDAQAWADQVVVNGGTVSPARLAIASNFIVAEKASGCWALTDDYFPLWGENALQSRTSLKQKRLASEVAVPMFTINRGYTFDGVAQYLNTGFVPSTHGVALTTNQARLAVYERTNVNTSTVSIGAEGGNALSLFARTGGSRLSAKLYNAANITPVVALLNSQGYSAASVVVSPLALATYKNGALVETVATPAPVATRPTSTLFIGARSQAGDVASSFRGAAVGFAVVGGALSAAQELAQYNAVQAWATAIGAQV